MNRGQPRASKAVFSPRWSSKFSEFPWYQRFRKGFPRKVGVRRVDPYSGTDLGDKGESHAVGRSRGFHIDWKPYEKPDRGSSKEDSAGTEQRVHVGFDRLVNGDGTNRREDLGAKHNEKSTMLVGPSANLGGEKRCPCKSGYSCVVCDSDKGIEARNVGLRKGVLRHAEEDGIGERDIEAASGGAKGRRRCGAVGAGGTDKSFCFDCVGNEARCSAEDGLTDRMEIGGEMGGGMEAGEKKFRFHFCGGNNCGLVGCSEGTEGRSFQTIEMGSDKRLFDSRDSPGFAGSRGLCKSDKGFNKGIGCVVEKGCSNGKIFGAFNKEGRDFSYHGYHVNWKKGRRGGDGKATKAFIEERSVLRGDDPVWRRSDVYGSSVKDGRDNSIVVRKHNICRRPKRSVLPRSLEEKNSPLHVTKIEPMLISFVKERMSQKRLKRFEFVWDLTFFPHKVCHNTRSTDSLVSHAPTLDFHTELDHVLNFSKTVRPESSFSRTHADLLVENGIAQKTSKPGLVENVPFTVIEQKATGLRQRFILWTKQSNERLVDDGYIADVPLGHISEYLDSSELNYQVRFGLLAFG